MAAPEHADSTPAPPPAPADGPGARLQAAREAAGLSLEQVAQQLKLSPRQVRALEEENFAQLPGRTFARGFVRNYARLLNLDGEDLLSLLPGAGQAPALEAPLLQAPRPSIAELPQTSVVAPAPTRWLIPIVLVTCIIAAAVYEWYRGALLPPDEPRVVAAATPGRSAAPAGGSATPSPASSPAESAPTAAPADAGEGVAEVAAPSVSPVTEAHAAESVPLPATALLLHYRGPSWTEIRDRDGQLLVSRLFAPDSQQAISGKGPFDIVIGNASEVSLLYRGAPIELSRYTRRNVARLRLD